MKTNILQRLFNELPCGARPLFLVTITALAAVTLISCEEKDLGKSIEIADPPHYEFSNLEWSPGDRFQVTFEVIAIGKEVGDFEIGLGLFSHFDNWQPDEIVLSERFSSKKSEEIVTIEWNLPDNLAPSSEDIYYKIIISGKPKRSPVREGGNSQPVGVKIVESSE